ncbi:MAG: glycosyltransferase family 4 protein [Nostochopsis sp.]
MMKVIMSAYACQPNLGSEEGVGWNWAIQIAKRGYEVHVVTHEKNRLAIEAECSKKLIENLSFHYIEAPASLSNLFNYWGWHYYAWQIGLAFKSRQLHKEIGFDLAHHITYATDWMPSGLAVLSIPFVWGPIGGTTHQLPKNIELNLSQNAKKAEQKRTLLQWLFKSFDPFLKLTMNRASVILPYTQEAVAGIPYKYRNKIIPVIHIGVNVSELPKTFKYDKKRIDTERGLRIITGGRLVHWKGFDLLVEGFSSHLKETGAKSKLIFTSLRQGGENSIKDLSKSLGVDEHIEFLGVLPTRDDVFREMQNCDLYALLTWRDGPPTAILEAMLVGLPILCLDIGAIHELVPDAAGFKIPMHSRQQIIKDISSAITRASNDRLALERMGNVGHKYVLEVHDWDKIGDKVQSIYQQVFSAKISN